MNIIPKCNSCKHCNVCKYKDDYFNLLKAIDNSKDIKLNNIFSFTIDCDYFEKENYMRNDIPIVLTKDKSLPTLPNIDDPYKITCTNEDSYKINDSIAKYIHTYDQEKASYKYGVV